jgi:hypothetical protein
VDCAALYGEIMGLVGSRLVDEIELQLLKASASRAKPRAKDDYHESVLVFEWDAKVKRRLLNLVTAPGFDTAAFGLTLDR